MSIKTLIQTEDWLTLKQMILDEAKAIKPKAKEDMADAIIAREYRANEIANDKIKKILKKIEQLNPPLNLKKDLPFR